MRNTNTDQPGHPGDVRVQEFLDMIAPSVIKFNTSLILYKVNLGERVFLNGTALKILQMIFYPIDKSKAYELYLKLS